MATPDKKSIFKKTPYGVPRKDLKMTFTKTPYSGTDPFRQFDERKERAALEKKIFPKKFGNYISERETKIAERDLRRERAWAKNSKERTRITKEIAILKNIKKM